jgi:hypothetical protein
VCSERATSRDLGPRQADRSPEADSPRRCSGGVAGRIARSRSVAGRRCLTGGSGITGGCSIGVAGSSGLSRRSSVAGGRDAGPEAGRSR